MKKTLRCLALTVALMLCFSSLAAAQSSCASTKSSCSSNTVKQEKPKTAVKTKTTTAPKTTKTTTAPKTTKTTTAPKTSKTPVTSNTNKDSASQINPSNPPAASMEVEQVQIKDEKQEYKMKMREMARNCYTYGELEQLEQKACMLEAQYPGVKAMPAECIISNQTKFKLDVPPIVKSGRTLIPIRAVTEGMGAEVAWDQDSQSVTITKDDTEIVIRLGDKTALVNGEAKNIDEDPMVIAQSFNNRTFVPLRFIAENLGVEIDWHAGSQTIEMNLPEDEQEQESTDMSEAAE